MIPQAPPPPVIPMPYGLPPGTPTPGCILIDHVGNKYAIPAGLSYSGDGDLFQLDDGTILQVDCTGHGFTYQPQASMCNLVDQYGNRTPIAPGDLQGFGNGDLVADPYGTQYIVDCPYVPGTQGGGSAPQLGPPPAGDCVLVDEFGGVSPIDATTLVDYQDGDVFQDQGGNSYTVQCGQPAQPEDFIPTFGGEKTTGFYVIGVKKRMKKVSTKKA